MPVQIPNSEGASTVEFKPFTCNIIEPFQELTCESQGYAMSPKCIHAYSRHCGGITGPKAHDQHREEEVLRIQLLKSEAGVPPKRDRHCGLELRGNRHGRRGARFTRFKKK